MLRMRRTSRVSSRRMRIIAHVGGMDPNRFQLSEWRASIARNAPHKQNGSSERFDRTEGVDRVRGSWPRTPVSPTSSKQRTFRGSLAPWPSVLPSNSDCDASTRGALRRNAAPAPEELLLSVTDSSAVTLLHLLIASDETTVGRKRLPA
ncbi:hypothetical protein MRX96_007366 [Rhipicephalus microplus]